VLLAFLAGCAGRAVAPPTPALPLINTERLHDADRLIDEAIGRGELPGAVLLVGRGDEVVYRKAYGNRAAAPQRVAMTADTIFDLASLTKTFATATAVMILIDRGKLKLPDRVAEYLPDFAANGKAGITVEQLLLHFGGLTPDNALSDYADGPAAAFARIDALSPRRPPGTAFQYSDVGYIVLGELVHRVDGRTLDRFAAEEIYAPLGMKDTCFNPPASWRSRIAPTTQRGGHWLVGEVHDPRAAALGGVAGHAGLFSPADDLARFCRMILHGGELNGHRILSQEAMKEMTRPRCLEADGRTHCRAIGFDVDTAYSSARGDRFAKGTTFGHTGFTGTSFWIDPPNRCYLILLSNRVHPDGKGGVVKLRRQVATAVAEALLGSKE
jgi:serine-type D-Ala-D-Ala carboxypeptidase